MTTVQLEPQSATIRLVGPVTSDSVLWLVGELTTLSSYYHYRSIRLMVDSPGGDAAALLHFTDWLGEWRRRNEGLVLHTVALTQASSAAAVIVSLGCRRGAYPSTQLLYHHGRVLTDGPSLWTQERLALQQMELARLNQRIVRLLAEHALTKLKERNRPLVRVPRGAHAADVEEIEVKDADDLAAIYAETFERDRFMTPETAIGLGLLDAIER